MAAWDLHEVSVRRCKEVTFITFLVVEPKVLAHFGGRTDGADILLHNERLWSCSHCHLSAGKTCLRCCLVKALRIHHAAI